MNPETFKIIFIALMAIALLAVFFLVVSVFLLKKQNEEIAERKNYTLMADVKLSLEY